MIVPTIDLAFGALGIGLLGLIFGIIAMSSASRVKKRYLRAFGDDRPGNIEELVATLHERVDFSVDHFSAYESRIETLEGKAARAFNRVGMVRFNPFLDTGADLSFSMALLNDNGDGVVITSLWGREEIRLYAKPMEALKSRYPLSQEEKQAIDMAANTRTADPQRSKDRDSSARHT